MRHLIMSFGFVWHINKYIIITTNLVQKYKWYTMFFPSDPWLTYLCIKGLCAVMWGVCATGKACWQWCKNTGLPSRVRQYGIWCQLGGSEVSEDNLQENMPTGKVWEPRRRCCVEEQHFERMFKFLEKLYILVVICSSFIVHCWSVAIVFKITYI